MIMSTTKKKENKQPAFSKDETKDLSISAHIIEDTLECYGIISKVVEVNKHKDGIEYIVDVVVGTPLSSIVAIHKEIGMSLASSSGDVEIEAPIPGRSFVGIKVPHKKKNKKETEKYKVITIEREKIIYKGILPQIKSFVIYLLKLLVKMVNNLIKLLNK